MMKLVRTGVAMLVTAAMPALALANISTCWIKDVRFDSDAIHVSFEASAPLAVTGTAMRIRSSTGSSFAATYSLSPGQSLQVKSSTTSPDRCELEPVVGPAFKGVAQTVWIVRSGAEPFVMASIVRAKPD